VEGVEPVVHDADDADEPGEGDELHDVGAARPVPDPMDRTWRHPSEIGRADVPPVSAPIRPRRLHKPRTRTWSLALGAAVAGSAITVGALAAAGTFNSSTTDTIVSAPGSGASSNGTTLAQATSEVRPAVVGIVARDGTGARRGSGVCIRHGTDIVTAAAIVGSAKTVQVTDSTGTISLGTVMGTDGASGLALVRITDDISTATFAHQPPSAGDQVYAIAADYVDTGIVTARDVWLAQPTAVTLRGLLGTNLTGSDAVGGAIVDDHGDVAGLMISDDGTAVPIVYVEQVVDSLRASGHVDHGWIGVSGVDSASHVAVVMKVDRGSPAAQAGIAPGDGILSADGHPLLGIAELKAAVETRWPGDTLTLQVQHGATVRAIVLHVASALSAPPPPSKGGGLRL
jgi:putative serine protease PepD